MTTPGFRRREFITGLASAAGALSACEPAAHTVAAPASAADEWTWVRDQFELSRDWVHMSGFLLASHPKPVRDAIAAFRRGLDENPAGYFEALQGVPARDGGPSRPGAEDLVRRAAGVYLGAEPSDIALTDSTTMGLGTLYNGIPLRPGDEILTTTHDHYATHEALRLAADRSGAVVRKTPLYEHGEAASAGDMVDRVRRAITPATKVVAVTWVHSSTGVKIPVREIAGIVARANADRASNDQAMLCVDGVHGFGVEDIAVGDLGCDFFVAGCHKWLLGPRGTGILWGKTERWPLLRPTIPHFGVEGFSAWLKDKPPPPTNASMMTPGGFHSFEHRWALREAFAFHDRIGKAKIAARIRDLNRQCKDGLATMRHVTLHTPRAPEISAAIVTFEIAGLAPADVVKRLHDRRIIATQTPYRETYVRVAPGLFNSEEDVDVVLRVVRGLA